MLPNTSCHFKLDFIQRFSTYIIDGKFYIKEICRCPLQNEFLWEVKEDGSLKPINKCSNCEIIGYTTNPLAELYYAINEPEYQQEPNCENCIHKFNHEIIGYCEEHYLPIDGIRESENIS